MLILDKILEQAIKKLLDEYFGEEIEATRNQCGFPKDKSLKNNPFQCSDGLLDLWVTGK